MDYKKIAYIILIGIFTLYIFVIKVDKIFKTVPIFSIQEMENMIVEEDND